LREVETGCVETSSAKWQIWQLAIASSAPGAGLNWRPWETSTGPRTVEGKIRSSCNTRKHGGRANEVRAELAELRRMMREMEEIDRKVREGVRS